MRELSDQRPRPSRQLTDLLTRALLDSDLGDRIFSEPDGIAESFGLSQDERHAIKLIDRRKFERRVSQLQSG